MDKRERAQALIELSATVEEADKVVEEYLGSTDVNEKVACLKEMFDKGDVVRPDSTCIDKQYKLMLESIINFKHN